MISGLPPPPSPERPDTPQGTPDQLPTIEVGALVGNGREAIILHKGERYRLRLTANDKLILTK